MKTPKPTEKQVQQYNRAFEKLKKDIDDFVVRAANSGLPIKSISWKHHPKTKPGEVPFSRLSVR